MTDAMRYCVLLLILLSSLPAQEVKHAPTVEQCHADQRLWLDKLENDPKTLPNFLTLHNWESEMMDCDAVDPDNKHYYYNLRSEIDAEQLLRIQHFVDRHGLWDKFIEEDNAGKR